MKVIILAGGRGTRLAEETGTVPKPMVRIAGKPMLWHLMSTYAQQGFQDFTIATGYLGHVIDDWVKELVEPWSVRTIFTGLETQTGGRIRQCMSQYDDEDFFVTYGDGLANVDLKKLVEFHKVNAFKATLTAVRPPARFGVIEVKDGLVLSFGEKIQQDSDWINGGFFLLNKEVLPCIQSDDEPFETGALPRLVMEKTLGAFQHYGFWKPMDTLREKQELEVLAMVPVPPWREIHVN
jgi:glucose-1-phosphate cytidylyltransferase